MTRSRQILSLPVVTLDEGKEIGRVRGLIIDPQNVEVAALFVQRSSFFAEQKVIPYSRVVSVGNNALTIQKAASAEKLTGLPQILNLVKEGVQVRGARVITEGGTALGYVEEFIIDPQTGKITALEISGNFAENLFKGKATLPAQEVRTIGKDVLVVRNGAEEMLERSEGKLLERVKNIKESTNRFVKKARQLHNQNKENEEEKEATERPGLQEKDENIQTPAGEPPKESENSRLKDTTVEIIHLKESENSEPIERKI